MPLPPALLTSSLLWCIRAVVQEVVATTLSQILDLQQSNALPAAKPGLRAPCSESTHPVPIPWKGTGLQLHPVPRCPDYTANCSSGFDAQQECCLWSARVFDRAKLPVGVPWLVSQPSSLFLFCKNAREVPWPFQFWVNLFSFLFHCSHHWPSFLLACLFFFLFSFFFCFAFLLHSVVFYFAFVIFYCCVLLFNVFCYFNIFYFFFFFLPLFFSISFIFLFFFFFDFFIFPPLFWLPFFPPFSQLSLSSLLPHPPVLWLFFFFSPGFFSPFLSSLLSAFLGAFHIIIIIIFRFLSSPLSLPFVLPSSVPCRPRAPLRSRAAAPRSSHAATAAVPHIPASQLGAGAAARQQISAGRPAHKKGGRQQAPSLRRRQDAP